MIAKLFSPLIAKVLGGALIACLLLAGVQTYRAGHWKRVATSLRLDLDRIKLASELAGERAKAAKAETEAKYRKAAERTDAAYEEELARARSATATYVARHRVRVKTPGGPPGDTPAPGQDQAAQGADGPAAASDMVVISAAELNQLTSAASRLKTLRDKWAPELVEQGLAEPGTTDPPAH